MALSGTRLRRRHIAPLVLAAAALPLAGLAWSTWQLLVQDRELERRQRQDRLDRAEHQIVAALQTALSESARAVAAGEQEWQPGAVAVTLGDTSVRVVPAGRIAFLPVPEALPREPSDVRTAALLPRGRELAAAGRYDEALQVFGELRESPPFSIKGVSTDGDPSWLAARYWRARILEQTGRKAELVEEASHLARDLQTMAPYLSSGLYALYAQDGARWGRMPLPPEPVALGAAVDALWRRWLERGFDADTSGGELLGEETGGAVVLWQTSAGTLRALIATRAFIDDQWLSRARDVAREHGVAMTVRAATAGPFTSRTAASDLPWTVIVSDLSGAADAALVPRRIVIMASFLTLLVAVAAVSYVAIRSVGRELAVAQQQSDFVAAVSHEFRTPLTSLKHFVELLREQSSLDAGRRRECYDAQARAVDRLSRLVESLLDFGRLEAGTQQYRFAPQDCAALAQSVVDEFSGHAANAGYRIAFDARQSAMVNVDAEAFSRALWNLLDNAMKYSPADSTIEIGVRAARGTVCIDVRDRGMGVGPGESRDIFRRFHRGADARSRGIRGTGLGLAMVVEIMQAHSGRVDLESQPGQGSTFTLVFPSATA